MAVAARRRAGAAAVAGAALLAGAIAAPAATGPKPAVARDAKGDVRSNLDLTRISLSRAGDGRLRGALTLAGAWDAAALRAPSGPPGSVCLKLWTVSDPPDAPPDFLVCATAQAKGDALRGSVLRERANQLPQRVAQARVSRPTPRTLTLRFSQTAIGRPAAIDVAGETSRAGCPRVSCIDTAPDAPATVRLQLRKPASTNQPG